MKNLNYFLISIDLEETMYESGRDSHNKFTTMVESLLHFFTRHKMKVTFFVVGNVARKFPEIVKAIYYAGHEIACHSDSHTPLSSLNKQQFEMDILNNIESLHKIGIKKISGYRAPNFSLIPSTFWAYDILIKFNFIYSSSVLPALNPLFGWSNFSRSPIFIKEKIIEIPVTVNPMGFPIGGAYMRILPYFLVSKTFQNHFNKNLPIFSYLHPYDIDPSKTNYMFPNIGNNRFLNYLLHLNRSHTLSYLENILAEYNTTTITYFDYVKTHLEKI
ncbi:DUF3473 domain-containing protein [Candidatus Woesebacteria bacterium]|nr:DUF3473 domain-containing protein [Candidatus Woesebacteria bacterium]